MSEQSTAQDRTLEPTPRKLEQARTKGDLPQSREGSNLGIYAAVLAVVSLGGGAIATNITNTLVPMIEQPEQFLELTAEGYRTAGGAVVEALGLALLPLAILLIIGALLPHIAQNTVVIAGERIRPKGSNLSPAKGFTRILGGKALFEFGKSLVKASAVAVAVWITAVPIFEHSVNLASIDPAAFPVLLTSAMIAVLAATALVAAVIAALDVPFQRMHYMRRQRMTHQELKEEMKTTEGDPHMKARRRAIAKQRSQRRMMADVPKATVIITNPTHFAVALRYDRATDSAPIVVAKGVDRLAFRIREIGQEAGVAIVEDPPLARGLYATVDIGQGIPRAEFERVAKIIGLVWAQKAKQPGQR